MTTEPAHVIPMLSVRGATKRYGELVAVDGVSLEVGAGECVALVGESGSGKSTLLRMFNRLVECDEGLVQFEGIDVRGIEPVLLRRRIGYVPQNDGLLPHWNVVQNVGLVPWLLGKSDQSELARRALELVGLDWQRFAARWPCQLSGGQRQRVAVARALAANPTVVLLDEPFGALDAITRCELQEMFLQLRQSTNIAALLVTHDLHEAGLLADRIAVMSAGQLEQIAEPKRLLAEPATPYVRELLRRARWSLEGR